MGLFAAVFFFSCVLSSLSFICFFWVLGISSNSSTFMKEFVVFKCELILLKLNLLSFLGFGLGREVAHVLCVFSNDMYLREGTR